MPDITQRSGVVVGRMHETAFCYETAGQYSATERHSAVVVVLVVSGYAPRFVPCSFIRGLFREESFARVFRQWFPYVSERSSVKSR